MKRQNSFATLAVILASAQLVSAPAFAEDERIVFQQDEFGWDFEKSSTLCVARGTFETGDGKTAYLELRKDSPADILKVLMVTEGLRMPRLETRPSYRAFYRLNPGDEQQPIVALAPSEQGSRRLVSMFDIYLSATPSETTASDASLYRDERSRRIERVDGLYIDGLFSRPISLPMASFANLSTQFDDCTDDILRTWGLDPARQRSLTRSPSLTNLPDLMDDLRKRMRQRNRATHSQFVYTAVISASGEVSRCHILPPASTELGELACSALRETGRFAPALDAGGQPVAGYMTGRMVFAIRD